MKTKAILFLSTLTLVFGTLFSSVQNVKGNTINTSESDSEWLPLEIDRKKYEALLEELGLEEDIPFSEDIPPEVLEKMSNSKILNEMAQANSDNNAIVPHSIKVIRVGKSIKQQGYMGNRDLRNYVAYVDKFSDQLGWAALISGFITYYKVAVPAAVITQFASGQSQFENVKKQAYAGNGMGWVHMYANGPNTLSVIPRRDFSSQFILYKE